MTSDEQGKVIDDSGEAIGFFASTVDARRFVACFNACAGIETDVLENPQFQDFFEREPAEALPIAALAIRRLHQDNLVLIEESTNLGRYKQQRDRLLNAARKAMDECCDLVGTDAGLALDDAILACGKGIQPKWDGEIRPEDFRVETFPQSAPGGFILKPSNGVRITHGPTGLKAESSEERSQHRNRAIAMELLTEALNKQKGGA